MSTTIVNGAPMTIFRGTDDKSTRALVPEPEVIPTHLPKVYIYAKKGPTTPQLVVGNSRTAMYGADSFDLRSSFATHATVLSNIINSQGNAQMVQRVKPSDAGSPASIRLYLDVLQGDIDTYEREADGSFTLDVDGLKVPTGEQVAGIKAKWVVAEVLPVSGNDSFGQAAQAPGDQTDGATQSVRYPIMDLRGPYFGADSSNFGIRIWAPTTTSSSPVDERIISNEKVYPFRIACVYRKDDLSTPTIVETLAAEQFRDVTWKAQVIDRNTDSKLSIEDVFLQAYQDFDSTVNPPTYGPFGEMHIYHANLASILNDVYDTESLWTGDGNDLDGTAGGEYKVNLINGLHSSGVPYETFELIEAGNSVRLSESSTIYAIGGKDGTMNETLFADLVTTAVTEYANENSVLMDSARYPESIIYDSGFPLATKHALCSFIAVRKDTFVVLSTHDVLGLTLTASQESSLAIALKTRLQLFPESEFFGTAVMRGMVVGRSGRLLQSQYTKNLPLTLEVARKAASYMGAGNGRWKPGFAFDASPLNNVSMFTDINVTFTPASVRNKDWDAGLNWVQSFGRRSYFFPALKTVYDNDTSVLNSFFTAMAIVELQKVGERAWRQFTGSANLTNAQLIERVKRFIIDNTIGRFDDRFVIEPDVYFTEADVARGYSWTTKIKIYAPNMKTVSVLSIEARRISDLEE
jgi:hypothetical protein